MAEPEPTVIETSVRVVECRLCCAVRCGDSFFGVPAGWVSWRPVCRHETFATCGCDKKYTDEVACSVCGCEEFYC